MSRAQDMADRSLQQKKITSLHSSSSFRMNCQIMSLTNITRMRCGRRSVTSWVEDEDGCEGFIGTEDEETFLVLEDHDAFAARKVSG